MDGFMIHEVYGANTIRKEIQHAHGDQLSIQTVALVVGAQASRLAVNHGLSARERGGAEEVLETGLGNLARRFLVDHPLVIFEHGILLLREGVGLQGDGEDVGWLGWGVDVCFFALVDAF